MKNYKIISDSSCDLSPKLLEMYDIDLVPYYASLDGVNYYKENVDLMPYDFHVKLKTTNAFPKTSLPPVQDYIDVFKKSLDKGVNDILCVCLTSKFSGSYQCANTAAGMLKDDYPQSNIVVLDSMTATACQGLAVLEIAKMREARKTIDETATIFVKLREQSRIYFTVDSLEYLKKGGRVGRSAALASEIFNIKPIIMLADGELLPYSKVRGRKKSIKEVIDITLKETKHTKDDYNFATLRSLPEEGEEENIHDLMINKHGYAIKLPIFQIGVTIGTHTGPTAVGIAFFPKCEKYL